MANKDRGKAPVSLLMNKKDGNIWHARLGHPSSNILRLVVPSISLPSSLNKNLCGNCRMGKTSKLKFARRESSSIVNFHTLHSDVWDSSPIIFVDGYRFYLIIIYECSQYTWFFPMRNKSEVDDLFIVFINYVKRQHSSALKYV